MISTELQYPNLFYYSKQHYKSTRAFESAVKYDAIMKECVRKKFMFWKKNKAISPETKEKVESQRRVSLVSHEKMIQLK